jgi:hypothetical protein
LLPVSNTAYINSFPMKGGQNKPEVCRTVNA